MFDHFKANEILKEDSAVLDSVCVLNELRAWRVGAVDERAESLCLCCSETERVLQTRNMFSSAVEEVLRSFT